MSDSPGEFFVWLETVFDRELVLYFRSSPGISSYVQAIRYTHGAARYCKQPWSSREIDSCFWLLAEEVPKLTSCLGLLPEGRLTSPIENTGLPLLELSQTWDLKWKVTWGWFSQAGVAWLGLVPVSGYLSVVGPVCPPGWVIGESK